MQSNLSTYMYVLQVTTVYTHRNYIQSLTTVVPVTAALRKSKCIQLMLLSSS